MKRMKFYCQIFILFFKKNPLVSGVYLATLSIGLFSIFFLYQSQMQTINRYRATQEARSLSISVSQMSADLWDYLESHNDFESIEISKRMMAQSEAADKPSADEIVTYYNRVIADETKTFGEFSSSDAREVLLGRDLYDFLLVNNQAEAPFDIEGVPYKVVGYRAERGVVELPYETYKQHVTPNRIIVYVKAESIANMKHIEAEIREKFGVDPTGLMEEVDARRVGTMMTMIIIAGFVVFINALFLYTYLLVQRDREFAIYRLLGLSKRQTLVYFLVETSILYGVSLIAAQCIYTAVATLLGLSVALNDATLLFLAPWGILLFLVTALFGFLEYVDRDRVVRL